MTLTISATLSLPRDAVTSTIVVYGGKGMGKTNLASVLVEEFAAAGLRFVVIDPMGVWWGLRHSTDGRRDGIKVLILGGIHAHLPIAPESGAMVADLVVEEDANVIIDISRRPDGSMWAISERIRFVRDYAKRLYQRQGETRRPIHQVIDEAARFAPQIVRQGEQEVAACMGAIAVLVEEGRNVGIGLTLVTQRSARLNKDVAELADCMVAFRIVGPNSMRAVLDWLGEHIDKSRLKDISEKVRSLPRGSALVVSPGWLEFEGIAAMRKRTTFDSSKTPEAGEELRASGPGAAIDVSRYRERFAKLIEEQKANDPVALRAKLAAVEKRLAAAFHEERIVEVPVLDKDSLTELRARIDEAHRTAAWVETSFNKVAAELTHIRGAIEAATSLAGRPKMTNREFAAQHFANDGKVPKRVGKHEIRVPRTEPGDASLGAGERKILTVIIQHSGATPEKLSVLCGYKRSSRNTYLQKLSSKGYIVVDRDRLYIATASGIAALGEHEELPAGRALLAHWLSRLPEGEATILRELAEAYPAAVDREVIADGKYKRSSRNTYLQKLAARGLVVSDRGQVVASKELFS